MESLVPGVLLKLLQRMNTDVKINGEHGSSLLQVVGIVPSLASNDLFSNQGFYLKVSDSSQAAYVSLPDEHDDLILSDEIQLGQFLNVDKLEAALPVPILRGVRPVPGRHPCVGTPEDILATHSLGFLDNSGGNLSLDLKQSGKSKSVSRLSSNNVGKDDDSTSLTLNGRLSHSRSKKGLTLDVKMENERNLKSLSSRSIPSSPVSSRLIPSSPKSLMKNFVQELQLGPKALRKSWEGNDVKGRESPKLKVNKHDLKPEASTTTTTLPRKSTNSRLPTKEGNVIVSSKSVINVNKAAESVRKSSSNRDLVDIKNTAARRSVDKKSSGEAASHVLPGNLIKISSSNRKLTDGRTSLSSLPSSLIKLSKEVIKHRDAAERAAIEAMQEASCAENLLKCFSIYSELSSSAKEDNPQPTVEEFFALHSSLKNAHLTVNSFSKAIKFDFLDTGENLSGEAMKVISDRRKQAASWVNAALSSNLSSFTVYSKPGIPNSPNLKPSPVHQPILVLENGTKNPLSKSPAKPRQAVNSKSNSRGTSSPTDWTKGASINKAVELAETLKSTVQNWFLCFVERFLEADIDESTLSDNGQIAGMLSQLKNLNDWLDEIECDKDEEMARISTEMIDRIRKKIYEYLLTHVESAAAALGCGSQSSPTTEGRLNKSLA